MPIAKRDKRLSPCNGSALGVVMDTHRLPIQPITTSQKAAVENSGQNDWNLTARHFGHKSQASGSAAHHSASEERNPIRFNFRTPARHRAPIAHRHTNSPHSSGVL